MDNTTPLEGIVLAMCLSGLVFAAFALGAAARRLVDRYRERMNVPVLMLAWERAIVLSITTVGLLSGLILSALLSMSPPTGETALGEVERWARSWLATLALPLLFIPFASLVAIAIVKFSYDRLIDHRLVPPPGGWQPNYHPNRRAGDPDEPRGIWTAESHPYRRAGDVKPSPEATESRQDAPGDAEDPKREE